MATYMESALTLQLRAFPVGRGLSAACAWVRGFSLSSRPRSSRVPAISRVYSCRVPLRLHPSPPSYPVSCVSSNVPSPCSCCHNECVVSAGVASCKLTSPVTAGSHPTSRGSLSVSFIKNHSSRYPFQPLPNWNYYVQRASSFVSPPALRSSSTVLCRLTQGTGKSATRLFGPSLSPRFLSRWSNAACRRAICQIPPQAAFSSTACDPAHRCFHATFSVVPLLAVSGPIYSDVLWRAKEASGSSSLPDPVIRDIETADDSPSYLCVQDVLLHPQPRGDQGSYSSVVSSQPFASSSRCFIFHSALLQSLSPFSASIPSSSCFFRASTSLCSTSSEKDHQHRPHAIASAAWIALHFRGAGDTPTEKVATTPGICRPEDEVLRSVSGIHRRHRPRASQFCSVGYWKGYGEDIANFCTRSVALEAKLPPEDVEVHHNGGVAAGGRAADHSLTQIVAAAAASGRAATRVFEEREGGEYVRRSALRSLHIQRPLLLYVCGTVSIGCLTVLYLRPRKKGMRIDRRKYVQKLVAAAGIPLYGTYGRKKLTSAV